MWAMDIDTSALLARIVINGHTAEIILGSLADGGVDFIHVTELEAWKAASTRGGPRQALRTQSNVFANGGLPNIEQAAAALDNGADIVAIARGPLANPDLPKHLSNRKTLNDFDRTILGPIANIKESELAT
jgi:2,4-dienoyl-CoA reductase-like NADH-dependent reductase (Old Yellow Enzyme family)